MKVVLSLFLLFTWQILSAQDTVNIYFDINISRIRADQIEKLTDINDKIDLIDVDSIHIIGMADSVGRIKANYRLSMRRAKEVEQFIFQKIKLEIPRTLFARGEQELPNRSLNRRVDIVFYYPKVESKKSLNAPIEKVSCYQLRLSILNFCNIKTFKKRRRTYVRIEREIASDNLLSGSYDPYSELYYGTLNDKNEFRARKVKWKITKTGRFWWKRKRYVTTLKEADFERFKFFTLSDPPCDTNCHEDFVKNKKITAEIDTCWKADNMVMSNLQYRRTLFNQNKVKLRVPKEYISLQFDYFQDYTFKKIDWDTKRFGRRKNYYFSKIEARYNYLTNIYRKFPCITAKNKTEQECDQNYLGYSWLNCRRISAGNGTFFFPFEVGVHFQNERKLPYAAIGLLYFRGITESEVLLGLHSNRNLYSSAQFKINFINLDVKKMGWSSQRYNSNLFQSFYVGPELKTNVLEDDYRYFEGNLNVGYSLYFMQPKYTMRFFAQAGYGLDFIQLPKKELYPIGQVGITFLIGSW